MKIIEVPYNQRVQSIIEDLVILLVVVGIALMISVVMLSDWKIFLVGSFISIPATILMWKIMTLQILFLTKDHIKVIDQIDTNGFSIINSKTSSRLSWREIQSVKLDRNHDLIITLKEGKPINLDKKYHFWYALLQKIPPSKLINSQIPDFLEELFSELETCKICGSVALKSGTCLSCSSDRYNEELKEEFPNEFSYIKSEQLELFSTEDRDAKVYFISPEDDGFQHDANWEPIVSEKEVIEYSKEKVWE